MERFPSDLPECLMPPYHQVVIAGGYAACPHLAGDIDLWVFTDTLISTRDRIIKDAKELGFHALVETPETTTEIIAPNDFGYDELGFQVMKVLSMPWWVEDDKGQFRNCPLHVMVTNAPGVIGLLLGFDVSTHQVAVTPRGDVVYGPDWTPLDEEPVKLFDTSKTDARMQKITARYQHLRKDLPTHAE